MVKNNEVRRQNYLKRIEKKKKFLNINPVTKVRMISAIIICQVKRFIVLYRPTANVSEVKKSKRESPVKLNDIKRNNFNDEFKGERFIVNFVKEKTARTTIFSECTHHIRNFFHITREKENLFRCI
jgi:hypothetical protein